MGIIIALQQKGKQMMENREISVQELAAYDNSYMLVDMRDDMSYAYGHLPEAVNIPEDAIRADVEQFAGKKVVIYCKRGEKSVDLVEWLCEQGIDAVGLKGGYLAWLLERSSKEEEEDTYHLDVEESLRKRFRKSIWCKFTKAVKEYELVKEGDKIAVCISGGKDSMLMAKLFQELKLHNKVSFELTFLVMNPGYSPENLEIIKKNAKKLHIPITIFETDIFDSVYNVEKSPCYLCARMRRGHLYNKAKELGCNKIALGHHYDDVIETILMGMLYGAQVQTMMPKLHSTNFEGMELIRPLYLVREEDIIRWRDYNHLQFIQCACRFTESCASCGGTEKGSKRAEIKALIKELSAKSPYIEKNIFRSVENVNLNTIVAYKQNGQKHSFLEDYDSKY